MQPSGKISDKIVQCQQLLYVLIAVLVFEGLIRKLMPSAVGTLIFFLKDFLCMGGVYLIFSTKLIANASADLQKKMQTLFFVFLPVIFYTFSLDPLLSLFGAKQYILYMIIAILVPVAFPLSQIRRFKRFVIFLMLLLVPTTLVAILQNSLPPTHWLNLSVGGESLEAFAAAGYLRVSSTFSFTGQYSYFLNACAAFLGILIFMPLKIDPRHALYRVAKFLPVIAGGSLIIGVFITGGRTAVLGSGGVVVMGLTLSMFKSPAFFLRRGLIFIAAMACGFVVIRSAKPEFFAAYEKRSSGHVDQSHSEEVEGRILGQFTSWTSWFFEQELPSIVFGNGIGVMSNGSDQISGYARSVRFGSEGKFWTETDFSTTLWEGGLYLALIWYGFRLMIIAYCTRLWFLTKNSTSGAAISFLLSFVVINGIVGALGIQPPLVIWWWLCIGAIVTIHGFQKEASGA
jgi:hypothetical protein